MFLTCIQPILSKSDFKIYICSYKNITIITIYLKKKNTSSKECIDANRVIKPLFVAK